MAEEMEEMPVDDMTTPDEEMAMMGEVDVMPGEEMAMSGYMDDMPSEEMAMMGEMDVMPGEEMAGEGEMAIVPPEVPVAEAEEPSAFLESMESGLQQVPEIDESESYIVYIEKVDPIMFEDTI